MAGAVAVGDDHPRCDTFTTGAVKTSPAGEVGTCLVGT